ncbi:MAG: TolC family protein [Rikenellaceae bacterium]|nr:TolC family protein [Rikenellaceae bacterium]
MQGQTADTLPVYTLQECLERGLEQNYSVRISRNEQQIASNNATWGNAGFLPEVTLSAGYNASMNDERTNLTDGTSTSTNGSINQSVTAGLDLSMTLFNGFTVQTNWRRLKELEAMGALSARITIEDFVASLTSEYYNLIQQELRLKNYHYAVQLSAERMRIVEARYLLGGGSRLEVLQARVDMNADSSQLINQKELVMTSRVRLNQLMSNDNVGQEFAVGDSLITINAALEWGDLHRRMTEVNAELLQAAASTTLSQLDLRTVQSRNYPYLRLNAGYGYGINGYNRGTTRNRHTWGPDAGLSLGFTIFDGNRHREIRNARIETDNARLREVEVQTALEANLSTFWQAYLNNLQLLTLERQNLVAARQNHEIAKERYMLGDLAGIEMREAQKSLLDASERILVAEYNTKMCEISLLQISGQILTYIDR